MELNNFINQLDELPENTIPNDTEKKLLSIMEIMKEKNIYGNEAVKLLDFFENYGFLGDNTQKAFAGRKMNDSGNVNFKKLILIRDKGVDNIDKIYTIDTEELIVTQQSSMPVIEKEEKTVDMEKD